MGRGVRSFKSWLFRGPRVKTERPIPPLSSRSRLNVPFFFLSESSSLFFFLRLVVCPGAHSQWIERNPFSGCELAFFFSFSSRLFFFVSSRIEKKKKKAQGEHRPGEREREKESRGSFSALSVMGSLSLTLSLFLFLLWFFFQSLPLTAIHRLHRPKLLDLSPLTTM